MAKLGILSKFAKFFNEDGSLIKIFLKMKIKRKNTIPKAYFAFFQKIITYYTGQEDPVVRSISRKHRPKFKVEKFIS